MPDDVADHWAAPEGHHSSRGVHRVWARRQQVNGMNEYYIVAESFEVFVREGIYRSNTYFGSSQAFGTLYRRLTLQPGDEVHLLVGGSFVRHQGTAAEPWDEAVVYEAKIELSEKHPFEKTYGGPREPQWPTELMTPVERLAPVTRREVPTLPAERVYIHIPVGRSIDYLMREDR